jgi:hypothetical protein
VKVKVLIKVIRRKIAAGLAKEESAKREVERGLA